MNLSSKAFQNFAKRIKHVPLTRTGGLVLIEEAMVFTSVSGNGLNPPSIINIFAYISESVASQVVAYRYSEDPILGWGRYICETGNGPVLVFLYRKQTLKERVYDFIKNSLNPNIVV